MTSAPVFPGRRYEDWVLDDLAGLNLDDVRPIRDEIERHVRRMLAELLVRVVHSAGQGRPGRVHNVTTS